MKMLYILMIAALPLMAESYKAKIEPYDAYTVASEVSGKIVALDQLDELKVVDKVVLRVDASLDKIRLKNAKTKRKLLQEQLSLKRSQYDSIKNLTSQNRFSKDQYKSAIITLKMQLADQDSLIAQLADTIKKKNIRVKNRYIKKLYVREGESISPGTRVMIIEDLSGGRVTIYVDQETLAKIKNAKITVDGDSSWNIEKIGRSSDEKYLSLYRVEVVKKGIKEFGKLVDIELKW